MLFEAKLTPRGCVFLSFIQIFNGSYAKKYTDVIYHFKFINVLIYLFLRNRNKCQFNVINKLELMY